MIPQTQKKKVLMVVKTYPNPSKTYRETVCTAAITEQGEWIRLYPLAYRNLKDEQQFKKYTWIEAEVCKNDKDNRPESYKVDESTIKILKELDSQKDSEERKRLITPLCKKSLEEIQGLYDEKYVSLGIFKPKEVVDLEIIKTSSKWTPEEEMKIGQIGLFDNKNVALLEKVPWKFSYKFRCDDEECHTLHKLKIADWEIYQTYRSFKRYYNSESVALKKLKEKWLDYFFNNQERESYFIVGTVYPHPTFIILGVFSYKAAKSAKKNSRHMPIEGQQALF